MLRLAARGGVRLVLLGRVRAGERRPRVPAACRRGRERRRREGRAGRGRGGRRLPGGGGGGDGGEPLRRTRRGCRSRAWSVGGHARSHTQWLAGRTKPSLSSWLTSAGERPLERIHAVCASLLFPPRHTILCPEPPSGERVTLPITRGQPQLTLIPVNWSPRTVARLGAASFSRSSLLPPARLYLLPLEQRRSIVFAPQYFCLSQSRGPSPQRSLCARACAAPVPERARLELQSSPVGHRAARLVKVGPLFARRHPVLVRFARAELPLSDELERDERARPSSRRAAFSSCTFSRPRSACSSP